MGADRELTREELIVMNNDLRHQLEQAQAEIEELKESKLDLAMQLEQAISMWHDEKQAKSQATRQLEEANEDRNAMREELDGLLDERNGSNERLDDSASEIAERQSLLDQATRELAEAKADVDRLREKLSKHTDCMWLDCGAKESRGPSECLLEGTKVCALCQLAAKEAEVCTLRKALVPLAEQDCETFGCDLVSAGHICRPQQARDILMSTTPCSHQRRVEELEESFDFAVKEITAGMALRADHEWDKGDNWNHASERAIEIIKKNKIGAGLFHALKTPTDSGTDWVTDSISEIKEYSSERPSPPTRECIELSARLKSHFQPITIIDDKIRVQERAMIAEVPYQIAFKGQILQFVKRVDGTIAVFEVLP